MCTVQGNILSVLTRQEALYTGEFCLIHPEKEYAYKLAHLFDEGDKLYGKNDLCLYVDADYSFYQLGMWKKKTQTLYGKDAHWAVFEHEVSTGVDVNAVVEAGQAKTFTSGELNDLLDGLLEKGLLFVHTTITHHSGSPLFWDQAMQQRSLEMQLVLNRLLPEEQSGTALREDCLQSDSEGQSKKEITTFI